MSNWVTTVKQTIYATYIIDAETPQAARRKAKMLMVDENWDIDDFDYEVVAQTNLEHELEKEMAGKINLTDDENKKVIL